MQTLVGYPIIEGHDHDGNCLRRAYVCEAGHGHAISERRACPTGGCGWKGKSACFCCATFVDKFPEAQLDKDLW